MSRRSGSSLGQPGRAGLSMRLRWNPQVLVVLPAVAVCFLLLREAIPSWIFWLYRGTYHQVDFVMERAEPNDGWPIIRGRLEPGGEEWLLEGRATERGYAVAGVPAVVDFEPGRRVRVWWSAAAPVVGFGTGRSTKIMPVSAQPRVPGLWRALAWTVAATLPLLAAMLIVGRLGLGTRTWTSESRLEPPPSRPSPPG